MRINRSIISNFNPSADVTFSDGVTVTSFAGTGDRMVIASSIGVLATQAIPGGTIGGSGTTNYIPKFTGATTLGNSLIYDSGTNVGIGTATPSTRLHLQNTGAVYIQLTDDADGASRVGQNGTSLTFGVDLADGSTERMRMTSGGNVLVGSTTDSGEKLQISGSGKFFGTKPQLYVSGNSSNGAGVFLTTDLSGSSRRNWFIGTEENIEGDFVVKSSNAAGGNPQSSGTTRLSILSNGAVEVSNSIKTSAPTGYTAKPYKLGEVLSGGATATHTVAVEIDGVVYFLLAVDSPS
jgi:hypothetical protein